PVSAHHRSHRRGRPPCRPVTFSMNPLGKKAREALFWTTGFSLFRDVLQLAQTLVLVRLLAPEAYGRFGLVSNVVTFYTVLSFREFLGHTLQMRDDRDIHYQDQFTAGAVIQLVICALMNLTALVVGFTSTYRPVAPLLHVMSLVFLLDLPSEFRVKMLERALEWRRLRLLNAAGMIVYAVASIALALAGAGAYALLVPTLLVPLPFVYDLFVNAGWRPTWQWSAANYRPALRFGVTRVTSGSLATGSQLLESSVLVHVAGFVALGFFGRAIGLAQLSSQKIATILAQSLYPVLTRIERSSDSYRRVSALMLRTIGWVVIPLAAMVAVLARAIVRVLYGPKWLDVVPLVPAAVTMGAVVAVAYTAYFLLLAHQQQRRCLVVDAVRLAGTAAALALLLPHGLVPYLRGLTIVHATAFSLIVCWLYRDEAIAVSGVATALLPPVVASLTALACVELVRRLTALPVDRVWPAVGYAALFSVIYLACLRALFAPLLKELVSYVPGGGPVQVALGFKRTPAASEQVLA
ncbi:MAG: oligosaccharide flippase family protein, partial [Bacteroidales bacterium]